MCYFRKKQKTSSGQNYGGVYVMIFNGHVDTFCWKSVFSTEHRSYFILSAEINTNDRLDSRSTTEQEVNLNNNASQSENDPISIDSNRNSGIPRYNFIDPSLQNWRFLNRNLQQILQDSGESSKANNRILVFVDLNSLGVNGQPLFDVVTTTAKFLEIDTNFILYCNSNASTKNVRLLSSHYLLACSSQVYKKHRSIFFGIRIAFTSDTSLSRGFINKFVHSYFKGSSNEENSLQTNPRFVISLKERKKFWCGNFTKLSTAREAIRQFRSLESSPRYGDSYQNCETMSFHHGKIISRSRVIHYVGTIDLNSRRDSRGRLFYERNKMHCWLNDLPTPRQSIPRRRSTRSQRQNTVNPAEQSDG